MRWNVLRYAQALPNVRGAYRISKFVEKICPDLFPVQIKGFSPVFIDPRVDSWQTRQMFQQGKYDSLPYETHIQRLARGLIRPTDTVIDVGANLGLLTVLFDSLAAEVHSVEPNPMLLPGLRETVRHLKKTTLYECALGETAGTASLTVPEDHSQASLASGTGRSFSCPVKRLDSLVSYADFIKIDVEGAELLVLKGATGLLDRPDAPIVLFEEVEKASRAFGQPITAARDYLASLPEPRYQFWTLHRDGRIEPYSLPRPDWSDVLAVPYAQLPRLAHPLAMVE
jgi:FkbM family methyltransferase